MAKRVMYTEELHVERLEMLLGKKNVCDKCPAAPYFNTANDYHYSNSPCCVCREFIGHYGHDCPCYMFGAEEALKKTEEALVEYYKKNNHSSRA